MSCPHPKIPRPSITRAATLLFCLLCARPAVAQGGYTYTPNGDGTLNLATYSGPGGDVTLPGTNYHQAVTSIGNDVFFQLTNLTSVVIPDSFTNIGTGAFYLCTGLTNVTLGAGLATISAGAFEYCSNLISLTIPDSVTTIGQEAFLQCSSLATVTLGTNLSSIADYAFYDCPLLRGVHFRGNAPSLGMPVETNVFFNDNSATVYYLAGAMGWGTTFAGRPAFVWNPQIQTGGPNFGVRANQFGFNITGSTNLVVVVAACADLAHPVWSPVSTNTLTGGSSYFHDPQWPNYPARFYRLNFP